MSLSTPLEHCQLSTHGVVRCAGITAPEEYGGLNMGYRAHCIAMEVGNTCVAVCARTLCHRRSGGWQLVFEKLVSQRAACHYTHVPAVMRSAHCHCQACTGGWQLGCKARLGPKAIYQDCMSHLTCRDAAAATLLLPSGAESCVGCGRPELWRPQQPVREPDCAQRQPAAEGEVPAHAYIR